MTPHKEIAQRIASSLIKAKDTQVLTEVTSFRELEMMFPFFHVSWDKPDDEDNRVIFRPRVPESTWMDMKGDVIEDNFTPRVSLSKTVKGAQGAVDGGGSRPYLYAVSSSEASRVSLLDVSEEVRRCRQRIEGEKEYGPDFNFLDFLNDNIQYIPDDMSGVDGPADLTDEGRKLWRGCVPDAEKTQEVWALEPVELLFLGAIDGNRVIPA